MTVFAVQTEKYSNSDAKDKTLFWGDSLTVDYPKSLFLSFVTGNSFNPGNFIFTI